MPLTLTRKELGDFLIYTKDEADQEGIEYRPWREAKQGEMCLSDDGYVSIVRKRTTYKDTEARRVDEVKTPFAIVWCTYVKKRDTYLSLPMEFEVRRSKSGSYNWASADSYGEKFAKKQRIKRICRVFAHQILTNTVDFAYLGRMIDKYSNFPVLSAKRLFRQKEIMDIVDEDIKELLSRRGINEDYVIDLYLDSAQMARDNRDPDCLLKCAKEIGTLLSMIPMKKTITQTMEITQYNQIAEKVEREAQKLIATKTTQEEI